MGGAISRDPTGANGGIGDDAMPPLGPDGVRLIPLKDDSETIPTSPRRALVRALMIAMNEALASGDLPLAQVALATLAVLAGGTRSGR